MIYLFFFSFSAEICAEPSWTSARKKGWSWAWTAHITMSWSSSRRWRFQPMMWMRSWRFWMKFLSATVAADNWYQIGENFRSPSLYTLSFKNVSAWIKSGNIPTISLLIYTVVWIKATCFKLLPHWYCFLICIETMHQRFSGTHIIFCFPFNNLSELEI